MPETLHSFSKLPWELRNHIWNLAVRPDYPGAHIFDTLTLESIQGRYIAPTCSPWSRLHISLLAYKPETIFEESGTNGEENHRSREHYNPSTYLIDSGLWTACKESRRVMEQRFEPQEWNRIRERRLQCTLNRTGPMPEHIDMMPATGYFVAENSERRHFTVFPHRDLFCIRSCSLQSICWGDLHYGTPIAGSHKGFDTFGHIAVEFDPAWAASVEKAGFDAAGDTDDVQHLIEAVFEIMHLDTLWIVDRTLKRNPNIPLAENRMIFYQNNCRFVEVSKYDYERWDNIYDPDSGGQIKGGCFWFVDALREAIEDRVDTYDRCSEPLDCRDPAEIRVLACEYF